MTFQVIVSDAADSDLRQIWDYIAANDAAERAFHVLKALENKIALLVTSPNVGNVPKELQELGIGEFRELHWKPYRIVYHIAGRKIWVDGVFDGRRDMKALLQQRLMR